MIKWISLWTVYDTIIMECENSVYQNAYEVIDQFQLKKNIPRAIKDKKEEPKFAFCISTLAVICTSVLVFVVAVVLYICGSNHSCFQIQKRFHCKLSNATKQHHARVTSSSDTDKQCGTSISRPAINFQWRYTKAHHSATSNFIRSSITNKKLSNFL